MDPFYLDPIDIPNLHGQVYSPSVSVAGGGAAFNPTNYYNLNAGMGMTPDGPTRTPLAHAYRKAHGQLGQTMSPALQKAGAIGNAAWEAYDTAIGSTPRTLQAGILKAMPHGGIRRAAGAALGSKFGQMALKASPALGVAGAALGVGDILLGNDSAGNKAMDAAAMGAGGVIGGFLGAGVFSPVTAAIGAGVGKTLSDATQFIVGGGKSEREKQIEALLASRGGI